jgi:hypothetical protein
MTRREVEGEGVGGSIFLVTALVRRKSVFWGRYYLLYAYQHNMTASVV